MERRNSESPINVSEIVKNVTKSFETVGQINEVLAGTVDSQDYVCA